MSEQLAQKIHFLSMKLDKMKQKLKQNKPIPVRIVKLRKINTNADERIRSAVWIYRNIPKITSIHIQKSFRVAVKTLMRYVRHSCNIKFKIYNLYFGDVGAFGINDQSRLLIPDNDKLNKHCDLSYISLGEMSIIRASSDIPELAATFLDQYMSALITPIS